MKITMDILGDRHILPINPAQFLLNSFAYADTGSVANHKIFKPLSLEHVWESDYGSVNAWKHLDDSTVYVEMVTGCEPPLVAKALGVFEYLIQDSSIEAQDIRIVDARHSIYIGMEDLTAGNLRKLTRPTCTPEDWWDSNVLPILEKIW